MDEAGADGVDGGGASGAAPDGASGATDLTTTTTTTDQAETAATGTVLEGAAGKAPGAIPEKFQVKNEDGSINQDASIAKWGESYAALEKRIVAGDLPPKDAKEYQVSVPEELKESWNADDDPAFQGFRDRALGVGLTQKQFDFVMGEYFKAAGNLVNGNVSLSAEEATAELKKEWKTDAEYQTKTAAAVRALGAYADKDFDDFIKTYGNDPKVIRMMARIGAEIKEDSSFTVDTSQTAATTIESLLKSEAYKDPAHPEHQKVSRQVADYYATKSVKDRRTGNVPVM
jgi:hypothetical protein